MCFHYIRIQETGWHALFMWWHSVPKQEFWVWNLYANHYKHNTGGARTNDRSSAVDTMAWKVACIKRHKVLVMIFFVFYNFSVLTLPTDHWDICLHRYLYLNMYLTL